MSYDRELADHFESKFGGDAISFDGTPITGDRMSLLEHDKCLRRRQYAKVAFDGAVTDGLEGYIGLGFDGDERVERATLNRAQLTGLRPKPGEASPIPVTLADAQNASWLLQQARKF